MELFERSGFHDSNGDYTREACIEDPALPLYAHQKNLPRLPIPPLEATCNKFLRSVRPLASDADFASLSELVALFVAPGGFGHILQQRLCQFGAVRNKDSSWLSEWWNRTMYLKERPSNVINCSYYFHFAENLLPWGRCQTSRAAALVLSALKFRDSIVSGQLSPVMIGKSPMCSTPFKYLFNACRIPKLEEDVYRMYDPSRNNHVAVVYRNKFFTFDIKPGGVALSFEDVVSQLDWILENAGPKESALGLLSTQDRDVWGLDREAFLSAGGGANQAPLSALEASILLLALDDVETHSRGAMARLLWHGDGSNRFFDKSIQLVVSRNGGAGLIGEHSMADGSPMLELARAMMRDQEAATATAARALVPGQVQCAGRRAPLAPPQKLDFFFSPTVLEAVERAAVVFGRAVSEHDMRALSFLGFGKRSLKDMGVSPDAFAQLAIQLAYFKRFRICRATYESSSVAIFLHGRTETIRSVSVESKAFVEAMTAAPTVNGGGGGVASPDHRLTLLQAAAAAHSRYTKEASQAHGVDRHFSGLRLMMKPGEELSVAAALFGHPLFARSKTWYLSTSALSDEAIDGWGFGEVVPDGVGIAYSVKNDSMQFTVSSRRPVEQTAVEIQGRASSLPDALCHYLPESLMEMKQLFDVKRVSKL